MPLTITDPSVTRIMCRNKQTNEARLAKEIYDQFNSGEPLRNLQLTVRAGLGQMVEGQQAWIDAAINEEAGLDVWAKINPKNAFGLKRFYYDAGKIESLTATDCSDLIRLIGCWVEKGGLIGPGAQGQTQDSWQKTLHQSAALKDAYRPGVQTGAGQWKEEVESVWADNKDPKFTSQQLTPRRQRGPGQAIESHVKPYMRNPGGFSGMGGAPANPQTGKRATAQSNVLKLDRLYGLLVGADISGTTSDTVFFLETWGHGYLTAAYYMLPLGTIAHNFHHTLIEVALALSINGVIDYRIGFYTSLLPKGSLPLELTGVNNSLVRAETSPLNRHFLAFYDGAALAGCVVFDGSEVRQFKESRLCHGTTMLRKAPALPAYPSLETVRQLAAEFGMAVQ